MQRILVIHENSVPYIGGTIAFLDALMRERYPRYSQIRVISSVDEAQFDGPAIIFIIGERLSTFNKRSDCIYVYMNFSVVAFIGSPISISIHGARLIWQKRQILNEKLRSIDILLDYYPAQTRILMGRLPCPVFGFLPCSQIEDDNILKLNQRSWDVCFVGGFSPRRERVLAEIRAKGLSLSPATGADLETLAAQSHITLNVHMQASNHLEIPRIIGSLSTGTPVVTEHSYGINEIVDEGVIAGRVGQLPSLIESLISDPARLSELSLAAFSAHKRFAARARDLLHQSLDKIDSFSTLKKTPDDLRKSASRTG